MTGNVGEARKTQFISSKHFRSTRDHNAFALSLFEQPQSVRTHEPRCMWSADQSTQTLSVVHQQLFLINPGDPSLLAASPQHVLLCLHTLISLVSVQNVPRTVISESVCPSVPSFIFPSLRHKSQRSSWNR